MGAACDLIQNQDFPFFAPPNMHKNYEGHENKETHHLDKESIKKRNHVLEIIFMHCHLVLRPVFYF